MPLVKFSVISWILFSPTGCFQTIVLTSADVQLHLICARFGDEIGGAQQTFKRARVSPPTLKFLQVIAFRLM